MDQSINEIMSGRVSNQEAPAGEVLSVAEIEKFLDQEDQKIDEKLEEELDLDKPEKEVKEDEPEIKEDEEDQEGEDEEEEERPEEEIRLVIPARKKEILAKYPEIFKDFPSLEKAYYLEQQYTELFGTPEEAKETADRVKILDKVESELMVGDSTGVLQQLKDNDGEAFNKLVDNYLPNLLKVDEKAYYHIVGNMFKSGIINMLQEAQNTKDEETKELLKTAADIWNRFFFNTSEISKPSNLAKQEDTEIKKEREERISEDFNRASTELAERIDNVIRSTVDRNIDPTGRMTDYVKRQAIRDVMSKLDSKIKEDARFTKIKDNLWKQSRTDKFSRSSLDKIKSAYMGYAKSILPSILQEVRAEALRGLHRAKKEQKDRGGRLPVHGISASSTKNNNSGQKKEVKPGMSTLDFLNED